MEYKLVTVVSTYKFSDEAVNPPKDSDHWLERYIYSCIMLKKFVRHQKKLPIEYLNIIGRVKEIGTGEYLRLGGKIESEDQDYYFDDYAAPKEVYYSKEEIRKESLKNNKIEVKFMGWIQYSEETFGFSKRKAKSPKEGFEKLWPKIKEIINDEIEKEKTLYINTKFLDRIMGQSIPRLSFKDQIYVRKNMSKLPKEVKEFVFGKVKNLDFSNSLSLNRITDFYEYPNLPSGGRIAQTIPDTLLLNYYKRMKENTNTNQFETDDFMNFISTFIGKDKIEKWLEYGTVYRYGETNFKKWFPASTELKGVLRFIRQTYHVPSLQFPLKINYGNVPYFDLYNYIRYLQKNLEYSLTSDPEKEVLIPKSSRLSETLDISKELLLG